MLENITLDNPCGDDIKYSDKFIKIETEVEKNFNISNTSSTQWDVVISDCENLLQEHTKDLKLLSYWLYAQKRLNGWDYFLTSFNIYVEILTKFNENLHPKVGKRKIKILAWIENVLEDELLKSLDEFTQKQLTALSSIFQSLETAIPLTIDTEDIFFKDSQKKCLNKLQQIENKLHADEKNKEIHKQELLKKKEKEVALAEIQQLRRSEEEETLSKFSSSSINDSIILTPCDIGSYINIVTELSGSLLQKHPGDYLSYKLLFSLGETLIEKYLETKEDVLNNFVPSDDIIKATRELEHASNISSKQLNALIEQLLIRPTWIEGYYIVSKVLYKLGRSNDAEKLENTLLRFLFRVQDQLNEHKMIPQNMAEWVQTKILSLNSNNDNSVEYKHAYQEVLKIKKEQSEQNALMLLEDYYQKSKNQESRFRWKLLFVDFALEIGDKKIALSLLFELEKIIEIHAIDKWQPELAITTYETLLLPIFSQQLKEDIKERIYNKLSILDIRKVIKLH